MNIIKTATELAELLNEKDLGEISVRGGEFEIRVVSKYPEYLHLPASEANTTTVAAPAASAAAEPAKQSAAAGNFVTSPIVGVFYSAPSPDKPAFVKIGDKVKKGQVVCIVESMKLMNEIHCEFDGTVAAILAMDGDAVDFGKELIRIE